MSKLRVLDLFSGIGGFSLGLERTGGFETVAFCEIEEFPRRVLAKHWPRVPCFQDVRKLTRKDIDGTIDVICGGYPCQPFSTAGKRQGKNDDRHLWPEFSRLVDEFRPAWVIGENVAGHISMGLDDVLADLEAKGYACRTFVIPACAVGASHRRDRVWTVAHAQLRNGQSSAGQRPRIWAETIGQGADTNACSANIKSSALADAENMQRNGCGDNRAQGAGQISEFGGGSCSDNVADAISNNEQGKQPSNFNTQEWEGSQQRPFGSCGNGIGRRRPQSDLGGVADGFSYRLDEPRERVKKCVKDRAARLKALGNAVHPDIPFMIGHAILAALSPPPP